MSKYIADLLFPDTPSIKYIADLLFPDTPSIKSIQDALPGYQERVSPMTTRVAPSPTGFLHLGTVYTGLVNEKLAHQAGGTFILRVEDTDQARNTTDHETQTGGIYCIVRGMTQFEIAYDEGMKEVEENGKKSLISMGAYGPYIQSERLHLYRIFAKYLVETDQAYPCFLTPEEMENIRTSQQLSKTATGIYGAYALSKSLSDSEIMDKLNEGKTWTIRRKAKAIMGDRTSFQDGIKGTIEMEDNYIDQVLLKTDGFPTFALAHIVDDYLMGVTHVIRSDEWLASVPYHIQLFSGFKDIFTRPQRFYNHISPIEKLDNGSRRKLSKRKDPEADVQVLIDQGYPTEGIKTYLMCLLNSNFEDRWKEQNTDTSDYTSYKSFNASLERCSPSGAIFDIIKLQHICGEYLALVGIDQLIEELKVFYNSTTQAEIDWDLHGNYIKEILSFDRSKKLHTTYQNIIDYILPFLQEDITIDTSIYPSTIPHETIDIILSDYISYIGEKLYNTEGMIIRSKEEWFDDLKEFGKKHDIASNNAEFKEGGYIAKVGDLAMILRIKLYGSSNTPDIYEMIRVMGKQRVIKRLQA